MSHFDTSSPCHCPQVRFFQVSESELEDMRSRFASGRYTLDISEGVFDVAAYNAMVVALQPEVDAIKVRTCLSRTLIRQSCL